MRVPEPSFQNLGRAICDATTAMDEFIRSHQTLWLSANGLTIVNRRGRNRLKRVGR